MTREQRRNRRPVDCYRADGAAACWGVGRRLGWLAFFLLVALLAPNVAAAQEEESVRWTANCGSSRPLAAGRCRIEPSTDGARPVFSVMFAYVGRELTFSIIGERRFTQGEIRIDGKQFFVTRICGAGYCFMDGQLATQLAEQFRRGKQVEIEVSTPAHDVNFTVQYDLKGFDSVLASFAAGGS